MSTQYEESQSQAQFSLNSPLRMLNSDLIMKVDDALCHVGEFGEVRLIVVKGRLRFIQTMSSESIDKGTPNRSPR